MKKTLLYRLFRIGGIPGMLRLALEAEQILLCDEGIGGWLITQDLKAPGKHFKHRREGFSGFLALTRRRLIACGYGKRLINVPIGGRGFSDIRCELVAPESIELSFDAAEFQGDWNGMITLRFNTPKAEQFRASLAGLKRLAD